MNKDPVGEESQSEGSVRWGGGMGARGDGVRVNIEGGVEVVQSWKRQTVLFGFGICLFLMSVKNIAVLIIFICSTFVQSNPVTRVSDVMGGRLYLIL